MADEGFKRKLTAILSADVAGYSRLMAEDETSTVKTLATYREVIASLIKQHRGWVVGYPVRFFYQDRVELAIPFRSSILPRASASAVYNLFADERRRVFRAYARRADVHSLPAAGKSALRDNHGLGRKGDNREEAVSMPEERKKPPA